MAMVVPSHPLRIPNFRAYWLARLAMTLAQNGMIIIVGWQTYGSARAAGESQHAAAALLGWIGLLQFLPLFLTTPVTGLVADRFDRRWITRVTITLQFGCALALAVATSTGHVTIPVIFAVAMALGIARAFAGPAFGALAPNLVPREVLPTAIALSSTSWQVGAIVGPFLAAQAYAVSPAAAYWLATALFALALAANLSIGPVPQVRDASKASPVQQIANGMGYVWHNKLVLGSITLDLFAVFLAGTTALYPPFAADILHVGPEGLSMMAGAPALGAALTAAYFSWRPISTNVGPKMLGAVIVYGCATILFGLAAHLATALGHPPHAGFPVALAALAVAGAADMFSVYIRTSLIQLYTPDTMRGRVGAVSQLTISASNELGEAESGFLASGLGPVGAVLVGGGGAVLVTVIWTFLFPALRQARTFDPPPAVKDEGRDMEVEMTA